MASCGPVTIRATTPRSTAPQQRDALARLTSRAHTLAAVSAPSAPSAAGYLVTWAPMLARPRAVSHRIADQCSRACHGRRLTVRISGRGCVHAPFGRGHLTPVLTRPADHPAESLRRPLFHVLPFCAPIIPSPSRGPRRRLPLPRSPMPGCARSCAGRASRQAAFPRP